MDKAESLLEWVNSFEFVSPKVNSLADLSDGTAILAILIFLAPEYFEHVVITTGVAENPILRQQNIKSILRAVTRFYAEVCTLSVTEDVLSSQAIGKAQDEDQLQFFVEVVIGLVVRSSGKENAISLMQGLSQNSQMVLMEVLQSVYGQLPPLDNDDADERARELHAEQQQAVKLEAENDQELAEVLTNLQNALSDSRDEVAKMKEQYEELMELNMLLEQELKEEKASRENLEAEKKDVADQLAAELENMRTKCDEEIEFMAGQMHENEASVKAMQARVEEVQKALERKEKQVEELVAVEKRYNDMMDEFEVVRSRADEADRFERAVEKCSERLESLALTEEKLKYAEDENTLLIQKNVELEEKLRAQEKDTVAIEKYRSQWAESEARVEELQKKLAAADATQASLAEKIENLATENAYLTSRGPHGASTTALPEALGTPTEAESLAGLTETVNPELRAKLARLEHENKLLREQASAVAGGGESSGAATTLLDEKEKQVKRLELKNEELKGEVEELRKGAVAHEEEMASVRDQMVKLRNDSGLGALATERLAEMELSERRLKGDLKVMAATLSKAESEKQGALKDAALTQEDLTAAQKQVFELQQKLTLALQDGQMSVSDVEAKYSSQAAEEKAKIEALSQEKSRLTEEVNRLKDQLNKAQGELDQSEEKIKQLTNEKSQLYEKMMALSEADKNHAVVSEKLRQAQEHEARLQQSLSAAEQKLAEAQEKVASLQQEGTAATAKLAAVEEQCTAAQSQVVGLKEALAHAEKEKHAAVATAEESSTPSAAPTTTAPPSTRVLALENRVKELEFEAMDAKKTATMLRNENRLMASAFYELAIDQEHGRVKERVYRPQALLGRMRAEVVGDGRVK